MPISQKRKNTEKKNVFKKLQIASDDVSTILDWKKGKKLGRLSKAWLSTLTISEKGNYLTLRI